MKKSVKRSRAGRPKNNPDQKTKTISFRVFEFAEPEIKAFFKKMTVNERTNFLLK